MNEDQTEAIITAIIISGFIANPNYEDSREGIAVIQRARDMTHEICARFTDL